MNFQVGMMAALLAITLNGVTAWADEVGARAQSLGGPDGVAQRLQMDENPEAVYPRISPLQPYFDWKTRLKDDSGLSFGLSGILLYQYAGNTLPERGVDAFGGIFRFQGSWVAFARDSGHPGRFEWRVENRSNLGGTQSPSQLGGAVGAAAVNTGFGYGDSFDTDLAVLNWTQLFADERAGVSVGRLAFDVYLDPFVFQTFSRAFVNRSFLLNPTLATTGIGALGAVGKGFVTDNVWIGAQVHDANAVSGKFNINTIEEGEFLYAAEIGWTPAIERYKTDRIQLTYWRKDKRDLAGAPEGEGWALSTSYQIENRWLPFLRWGHSDGGAGVAAEDALSLGVEYTVRKDQALALGWGWAAPSERTFGPGLSDEYVVEASYRMQISPSVSLMPDLQVVFDPAQNPDEDTVWVAGIRGIVNL